MLLLFIGLALPHCRPSASGPPGAAAESPLIEVTVLGCPAGPACLIGRRGGENYRLDTAAVDAAGRMVFQRAEPYPAGMVYVQLPDQSFFPLLVDRDQRFLYTSSGTTSPTSGPSGPIRRRSTRCNSGRRRWPPA